MTVSLSARRCVCNHTEPSHDELVHQGCRWCSCPGYTPIKAGRYLSCRYCGTYSGVCDRSPRGCCPDCSNPDHLNQSEATG